jgi:hypothetical protein
MSQYHLLWWIFDFLLRRHPTVLAELLNGAIEQPEWVTPGLVARFEAMRVALGETSDPNMQMLATLRDNVLAAVEHDVSVRFAE